MGKNLNTTLNNRRSMKHIGRSGLGFLAGLFALWGIIALINKNWIGIIAVIIAIVLFYYAWKG